MELILDKNIVHDGYNCYRIVSGVKVFGYEIPEDELEYFNIYISKNTSMEKVLPIINRYLQWLSDCHEMLVTYFEEQLQEKVPENWYEEIEVIQVSLVINNMEDYGATITFGESIFCDHVIELNLEKEEIEDCILNG